MPEFWKNNKKIKTFFSAILALILAAIVLNIFRYRIVVLSGKKFVAQVSDNRFSREKGLSGRKNLCRNCSMLFEFETPGRYSFWMKGMKFDLDIIWIKGNKIVYIKKNFFQDSLETISPNVSSDKVLEINAGLSDEFGFKVGDKVRIY